jgi:hypothetical protein
MQYNVGKGFPMFLTNFKNLPKACIVIAQVKQSLLKCLQKEIKRISPDPLNAKLVAFCAFFDWVKIINWRLGIIISPLILASINPRYHNLSRYETATLKPSYLPFV